MKKLFLLFLLLVLFSGCADRKTTADGLPILKINDEHLSMNNYPGKLYEIPPGDGFALDLAGYQFRVPKSLGISQVNSIQVVVNPEQIYQIPIQQDVTLYSVKPGTLTPVGNSTPFNGVKAGENITVGVGYTFPDGRFYPAWMGIISIMEKKQ